MGFVIQINDFDRPFFGRFEKQNGRNWPWIKVIKQSLSFFESPNKNSRVKSKFGGDPLLRKVFEKHYGQPKKTFSKKRGKENRDEPGPSKKRDSENFTEFNIW